MAITFKGIFRHDGRKMPKPFLNYRKEKYSEKILKKVSERTFADYKRYLKMKNLFFFGNFKLKNVIDKTKEIQNLGFIITIW